MIASAAANPPARWLGTLGYAVVIAVGCSVLAYRHGLRLAFDAYYYCELAKEFSRHWPQQFGNSWPFGFPLLGALLARMGVPAYLALCAISGLALIGLLALVAWILRDHPVGRIVVAAAAAAPIIQVEWFGVLSELPFAFILLGLAVSLAHWPARWALWSAAACAVIALTLRYVGLVSIGIIALWILLRWRDLRADARLREAIGAWGLAALFSLGLLAINFLVTGRVSGADHGHGAGLSDLPRNFSDFFWSPPSALVAGGLRDWIGADTICGFAIGFAIAGLLAALGIMSWRHHPTIYSRPLVLATFAYAGSMIALRCISAFDELYNARTFLPVLMPTLILAAQEFRNHRRMIRFACVGLLAFGVTAALRGISLQVGGDVRSAVALIRPLLSVDDEIGINDHAFALTAYLPQRTRRIWPSTFSSDDPAHFVVVVAKPRDRRGSPGKLSAAWQSRAHSLVAQGTHRILAETSESIVLERIVSTRRSAPP